MITDIKSTEEFYSRYELLFSSGLFCSTDRYCADYILKHEACYDPTYHLLLLVLSYSSLRSHVCYRFGSDPFGEDALKLTDETVIAQLQQLCELLSKCESHFLKQFATVSDGSSVTPVVIYNDSIYLYKNFYHEKSAARILIERASRAPRTDVAEMSLAARLLFPDCDKPGSVNWQYIAAQVSLRNFLTVITGGPGTGKTTTVFKIFLLLYSLYQSQGRTFSAVLTAPTGKAAARMQAAFGQARRTILEDKTLPDLFRLTDDTGDINSLTLHRLIGLGRNVSENDITSLPYDLVIVDEASMMSLSQLYKLLIHLRDDTSLILLGDSQQLSSVDAGAVLADICEGGNRTLYSEQFTTLAQECGCKIPSELCTGLRYGLRDSVVYLTESYRFSERSSIGLCATAIKAGDTGRFMDLIEEGNSEIKFIETDGKNDMKQSIESVIAMINKSSSDPYGSFLNNVLIEDKIIIFNQTMFLCAVRSGPCGVESVNTILENYLRKQCDKSGGSFDTRPILITKNMYDLDLYNGDTGLSIQEGKACYFYHLNENDYSIKKINFSLINHFEPVYCMTVHKSQGSEYNSVVIVLPDRQSPVLSRELLYTAFTRAKKRVYIIGRQDIVKYTIETARNRMSGLSTQLYGS
ncbi:MAG: exodeoxyribonuclease V subunit alpha [Spirochaetes bacterium]|jgi:exodeoxyribonuclease V alpha subunit|nr:exodeoxyribonuclease V subunit alpha [Spirochaetota bacterium]